MAKVLPTPPAEEAAKEEPKKTMESAAGQEKPAEDKTAAQKKRHKRRMRALRSFLFRTISLALVIYILFFHIVGITMMPGRDMYPRLDSGDLLLYYRLEKNLKFQDIIVFEKAERDGENPRTFVCRIIGAPGNTVEVTEERGIQVNGNALIETNIFYPTQPYTEGITEYPIKLGEGEYFVMADQRNGGMDSRYFGTVKSDEIKGVVITILRRNNL